MIKAEAWASHWSNTDPKTTNNQIHRIEKTMIDALIGGKVHGQPQQKTTKAGKPFAVAKVKVPTGDGQAVFCSVVAFADHVVRGLLALGDGDPLSLTGALTVGVWTTRDGEAKPSLDLVASGLLTPYHISKRRAAMTDKAQPDTGRAPAPAGQGGDDFIDAGQPLDF